MSYYNLERFEKIEELGKGGYGAVYKVKDKLSNNHYALKEIFNKS